ncbi:MAG: ABC transporter substrate-binding protein [bacterium]
MTQINEYLRKTVILGDNVNEVSQLLNKNNDNIQKLTRELEVLFAHFSRGNELIHIIHDYSKTLQKDILKLKDLYSIYETTIEDINDQLLSISELLKSLINMLQQIQNNADLFVKSAKSLANLAKNTEICAHHAKREGKGLAVIAKECLSLAKLAQLPFQNFSTLLNNLEQITRPVILELSKTIELSSRARGLLRQSFESLRTIDDTTASLQKIITQLEQNSIVNNQLKSSVSEGLDVLKKQLTTSLNTIDEISIHCTQINSLAQTLCTLSDTMLSTKDQDPHLIETMNISYLEKQYNFFLQENMRTIEKFSGRKKPPLFPSKIYQSIGNMTEQIDVLYNSLDEIHEHKENLGTDLTEIIDLGTQIEVFFKEIQNIDDRFNNLGENIDIEIRKTEELVSATAKIFKRIKTLSVFAKIEQGRSSIYKDIISPIVEEFVQLEAETEQAFASIIPQLTVVRKNSHTLGKKRAIAYPGKIKPPDYSKIRIFLDDISRVFGEEKKQAETISNIISGVDNENTKLGNAWQAYEEVIKQISELNNVLKKLFVQKHDQGPVYIKAKRILTASLSSEPLTLKPDQKTDVNSHQVICNCSAGLFQFGSGADIIPGLCQDYSISRDGREYIFRLRDNLKYHNGRPIYAQDIREAILRALKGPNNSFYDMIIGAPELIEDKEGHSVGIEIINEFTLKVNLEYPFRPILANLACNIADPYLDKEIPVGAGPFKLVDWEKGDRIILQSNDYYFEGRPTIDEFYFLVIKDENLGYELFKNRSLSIFQPTGETLKRIRTEMPKSLYTIPELSIQYLCINCEKEPFDNKLVRQALSHAINTNELVNTFLKGSAIEAKGIFPPSMKVFNRHLEGYSFDPKKSMSLLKDGGFAKGLPGIYKLDIADTAATIRRAEYIKESFMKIGVRIEINPMPWHNMIEKTYAGDSLLSFRGWVSDNGDPDNFVYPLFHSASRGRSGNTFFFSSPDIDHDIDQARKIRNFNQRNMLYQRIERKILDEAPGVFLYHRLQNLAVQKDVFGIKPHPLGLVRTKYVCPSGKHWSVLPRPTTREENNAKMVYAEP